MRPDAANIHRHRFPKSWETRRRYSVVKEGMAAKAKPVVFRINDNGQGSELVQQVFLERGWTEFASGDPDDGWVIWWRSSRFRRSDYGRLLPWQHLNHYPQATGITKKDSLTRNMKRMRGVHGATIFNFSPLAFNLPNDYTRFLAEFSRQRQRRGGHCWWICKPADLSRGRGIVVFRALADLHYTCSAVVQRYISNPFLIAGYKFDMRIYVAVPSFLPLRIYVYQEGIVRFSTEKYDLGDLGNVFSHLTNTSIQKRSPGFSTDKQRVGSGCKWVLSKLRNYFRQSRVDDGAIFRRIVRIIVLTLITQAPQVPHVSNCFELYGFDILVDEGLKPWLLEVNFSPALAADTPADMAVKKSMLHDLMDLIDLKECSSYDDGQGLPPLSSSTREDSSCCSDVARKERGSNIVGLPSVQLGHRQAENGDGNHEMTSQNAADICSECRKKKRDGQSEHQQRLLTDLNMSMNGKLIDSKWEARQSLHLPGRQETFHNFRISGIPQSLAITRKLQKGESLNSSELKKTVAKSRNKKCQMHVDGPLKKFSLGLPMASSCSLDMELMRREAAKQQRVCPVTRVGDFFLIFPFNDKTRHACFPKLDMRVSVSETHRLLKEPTPKLKSEAMQSEGTCFVEWSGLNELWSPVRPCL